MNRNRKMETKNVMVIPIYRKILLILFTYNSLRNKELYNEMQEEPKSSFYNALKRLETGAFIKADIKIKKLAVYSLTDKGRNAVQTYKENAQTYKENMRSIIPVAGFATSSQGILPSEHTWARSDIKIGDFVKVYTCAGVFDGELVHREPDEIFLSSEKYSEMQIQKKFVIAIVKQRSD